MDEKIFEPRLETLLITKAFTALTADEKAYTLTFLTEEEYVAYAVLMKNYKSALLAEQDHIQPSPKTLDALTDAFRAKNGNSQKAKVFRLTRVQSILGAAAAVIIVIGCLFIFGHTNQPQQSTIAKVNKVTPVKNNAESAPQTGVLIAKNKLPHPTIAANTPIPVRHKISYADTMLKKTAHSNLRIDFTARTIIIDSVTLKTVPCLDPSNTMMASADIY